MLCYAVCLQPLPDNRALLRPVSKEYNVSLWVLTLAAILATRPKVAAPIAVEAPVDTAMALARRRGPPPHNLPALPESRPYMYGDEFFDAVIGGSRRYRLWWEQCRRVPGRQPLYDPGQLDPLYFTFLGDRQTGCDQIIRGSVRQENHNRAVQLRQQNMRAAQEEARRRQAEEEAARQQAEQEAARRRARHEAAQQRAREQRMNPRPGAWRQLRNYRLPRLQRPRDIHVVGDQNINLTYQNEQDPAAYGLPVPEQPPAPPAPPAPQKERWQDTLKRKLWGRKDREWGEGCDECPKPSPLATLKAKAKQVKEDAGKVYDSAVQGFEEAVQTGKEACTKACKKAVKTITKPFKGKSKSVCVSEGVARCLQ